MQTESTTTTTTTTTAPIFKQKGTGLHIDANPFNLWETIQQDHKTYLPLDRYRPFQTFVALTDTSSDESVEDGGFEVVPGFHTICEHYFQNHESGFRGISVGRVGPYNCKFNNKDDKWIFDLVQKAQRMPQGWSLATEQSLMRPLTKEESENEETRRNCAVHLAKLGSTRKNYAVANDIDHCKDAALEHRRLPYTPIQAGDFVFWDIRTPHQNSDRNDTDVIRSVFYHAYLVAQPRGINDTRIAEIREKRRTKQHPTDFSKRWDKVESDVDTVELDSKLARLLYNEEEWDENDLSEIDQILAKHDGLLTQDHIDFYNKYGYVVIENLFDKTQATDLYNEIVGSAKKLGVDVNDWKSLTQKKWGAIGGTFGGMVEFCWQTGMQKMRIDERPYAVTSKLLRETWANKQTKDYESPFKDQYDPRKLWLYIDRTNLRLPNSWIDSLGIDQTVAEQ